MTQPFSINDYVAAHLLPIVPPVLAQYTCGPEQTQFDFVRSGAEVFLMFDFSTRQYDGRSVAQYARVLDFGCGNGRILRFIDRADSQLFGCDISGDNIAFVQQHFPHVSTHCSPLMPPLAYPDAAFDLIYSFSVFSHLSLDAERIWLPELVRIGSPGCLYLISVHGDWVIEATLGDTVDAVRQAGFFWCKTHGADSPFPDYYEVSYHTSDYIRQHWSQYFDILGIVKGDNPLRYVTGPDDAEAVAIARQLRPMGQDLVIARKRA